MTDTAPADVFEAARPRLLGLAYRMLGSRADAEDVVQEAWLRWSRADRPGVREPDAWLTTVTTRLALDRMRTTRRRREAYVGPWLPEPVATGPGPEEAAELADSLTLGFLVLLDRLTPAERAALLLADVFATPYAEVAATLGRSEEACRQLTARARRKLRAAGPAPDPPGDPELLAALVGAVATGDVSAVLRLLDPDVVLLSDAGPHRRAARRPVVGPQRVARLLTNLVRRYGTGPVRAVEVNGGPAVLVDYDEGPLLLQVGRRGERVGAIWILMNPDKLAALDRPGPLR